MNQSFNTQQLLRLCSKIEYAEYNAKHGDLTTRLNGICDEIAEEKFEFQIDQVGDYFLTRDLPNRLVLRKLNDNIKRIYKDEQANRRLIIAQVANLLSETCPYWIVRSDIKSFYEGIDRNRILSKFQDDSLLSYQSQHLIGKVFNNPMLVMKTGVPRGMNISATLSEIYMRKFDKWVRKIAGIYYYARFVDDLIIFSNSLQICRKLLEELDEKLPDLGGGLRTNFSKTGLFKGATLTPETTDIEHELKTLDYLGYSFKKEKNGIRTISKSFQNVEKLKYTIVNAAPFIVLGSIVSLEFNSIQDGKIGPLQITIAKKKIKKIKTRVVKSFLDYAKSGNFALLEKRIKFLTGNYSIRKDEDGSDLRAGIYYNYLNVTQMDEFNDLTFFYRRILFSTKIKSKIPLSNPQKDKLNKYCFLAGFENKVYNEFTSAEMRQIIRCWNNGKNQNK
jgi:hypothetical protein